MLISSVVYVIISQATLFLLLIIYLKWSLTYWKRQGVPYLKPSIPFGNFQNPLTRKPTLGLYYKEFYDEFKRMRKGFGGIYSYIAPIFVPIDPNIVKLILHEEFASFHDKGQYYNERDQPASVGLSRLSGEKWRKLRAKLTPTFTSARVKNMFPLMLACAKSLEKYVRQFADEKKPLIVGDCVKRLTTDVIGSCAFGIECNSFEDVTFYRTLQTMFTARMDPVKQTFCTAFPNLARFLKIVLMPPKQVDFLVNSINETMKYREEKNVARDDFLQILSEMKNNGVLDMNEIYAQSILFFVAGHGTTASVLTCALFELARNGRVQEELRKEVRNVLAKHDGEITYEAINEMKYLHMVLQETVRKHPPITTLKRKCVKDHPLPNSNVTIKEGTIVYIPVLGLHHDREYFPDPEKFIPERFSEVNVNKIPPYTYLPFGEGPRFCIGDRFGKLQVKIGITSLIRYYKISLNSKVHISPFVLSESLEEQNILLNVDFVED